MSTTDTTTAPVTKDTESAAEAKPKATTKKAPAKKEVTPKPVEPGFEALANELAAAEQRAKASAADAAQNRAQRQTTAVNAIKTAFASKIDPAIVRSTLLNAGVLKGTVSKIVTVLDALNAKSLQAKDVKSLNGAYSLVKAAQNAARAAALGIPTTGGAIPDPTPAKAVVATTPEEALEIILSGIKNAGSEDAVMKAAQKWITKFTDGVTAIMSATGSAAE